MKLYLRKLIQILSFLILLFFTQSITYAQNGIGYALSTNAGFPGCGNYQLIEIDLATGNGTCQGSILPTFPSNSCCPSGGVIFNNEMYFWDIDRNTGLYKVSLDGNVTVTNIGGANPDIGFWQGLELGPNGVFYGLSTNGVTTRLYTIDISTGTATTVGNLPGVQGGIWLTIDPNTGDAFVGDVDTDRLHKIDLATATVISSVPLTAGGGRINLNFAQDAGFVCAPNGLLYGTLFNFNTFSLQYGTIDPQTGVFTLIQDYGFGQLAAFAAAFNNATPTIPTLSEWGFIIFALLLLIMGTVALKAGSVSLANPNGQQLSSSNIKQGLSFDKKLFFLLLPMVALSVLAIFTIAIQFFGYELTNADPMGSLLAIPLVTYLGMLLLEEK